MGPSVGPWRLRFLIVGGDLDSELFLTNHGFDKVVTIGPESDDGQNWFALGKGEERFIITPSPQVLIPPGLARKGDSVILSGKPDEWRLQYVPINLAGGDVYKIHSKELIGAELLLGKEKYKNEAVIEAFVVGYDGPKPAWQFQAFNE